MRFAFVLALTAPVVLGVASVPLPQTPGSNIHVTECNVHRHPAGVKHPWVDPYGVLHQVGYFPGDQGFLAIAYRNTAAKPVTSVDFGLVSRGELVAVAHDEGNIGTNAVTAHEFVILRLLVARNLRPDEFLYCAVLGVTYADGTSWRNPKPPL